MNRYLATVSLATVVVLAVAACGASEDEPRQPAPAMPRAAPAAESPAQAVQVEPAPAPVSAPAAAVTAIAAAGPASEPVPAPPQAKAFSATVDAGADRNGSSVNGEVATLVRQQRIVVRTMDMGLVVDRIQASMDRVASIAASMGGWIVSSGRSNDFLGRIAVRVPAERLDEAVARVRDIAVAVESEVSTSKDVTAEYFDSQSRVRNLRATETAMLALLEKAPNARDALAIRESLSEVQEELEVLLGRLKLLEETSAFSLMKVTMRVEQVDLRVDAGDDPTVSVGQTVRFKAHLPDTGRLIVLQRGVGLRRPLRASLRPIHRADHRARHPRHRLGDPRLRRLPGLAVLRRRENLRDFTIESAVRPGHDQGEVAPEI